MLRKIYKGKRTLNVTYCSQSFDCLLCNRKMQECYRIQLSLENIHVYRVLTDSCSVKKYPEKLTFRVMKLCFLCENSNHSSYKNSKDAYYDIVDYHLLLKLFTTCYTPVTIYIVMYIQLLIYITLLSLFKKEKKKCRTYRYKIQ